MSAVLCVRGVALLCVCCKLRAALVLGWHPESSARARRLAVPSSLWHAGKMTSESTWNEQAGNYAAENLQVCGADTKVPSFR